MLEPACGGLIIRSNCIVLFLFLIAEGADFFLGGGGVKHISRSLYRCLPVHWEFCYGSWSASRKIFFEEKIFSVFFLDSRHINPCGKPKIIAIGEVTRAVEFFACAPVGIFWSKIQHFHSFSFIFNRATLLKMNENVFYILSRKNTENIFLLEKIFFSRSRSTSVTEFPVDREAPV